MVFGILLIVPFVDFALAAPVLVQEKRQACADMADTAEYPVSWLGKRGGTWGEIEEVGGKYLENWFVPPKEPLAAHGSSSSAPSEPGHVSTSATNAPAPNPGPSTEPDHLSTGMQAPQSATAHAEWFPTDHGSMRPHASQPNSDEGLVVEEPPSRPASQTEFDVDHEYQVVHPPPSPGSASPTEPGYEMVDFPTSSPVSSDPNRESMNADSPLENLQTDSDALKGQAKQSRRDSGTARDVRNAAQSELQPEKSHARLERA
jgi:hypothetical protein